MQSGTAKSRTLPRIVLAHIGGYSLQEIRKQVARPDREGFCQLDDILQGDVPFAALDPADVVPVETSPFGQFFLGIAPLVAELPQPCAESRLNGAWSHISMLEG